MDAFCPRCQSRLPQITDTVEQRGTCPKCGGQLNFGGISADLPVEGAIAMTFAAGSKVAVALDASFDESKLDLEAGRALTEDTQPRARRPLLPAPLEDEDTIRTPPPFGGSIKPPPPPADDVATVEMRPMADLPSPPKVDLPEMPDSENPTVETPIPPESAPAAASSGPTLGAHLQLPSIDFSLPDFGKPGGATAAGSAPASAPASELPAHLQLPSFPDFQLPPIPGVEK